MLFKKLLEEPQEPLHLQLYNNEQLRTLLLVLIAEPSSSSFERISELFFFFWTILETLYNNDITTISQRYDSSTLKNSLLYRCHIVVRCVCLLFQTKKKNIVLCWIKERFFRNSTISCWIEELTTLLGSSGGVFLGFFKKLYNHGSLSFLWCCSSWNKQAQQILLNRRAVLFWVFLRNKPSSGGVFFNKKNHWRRSSPSLVKRMSYITTNSSTLKNHIVVI